MFYLWHILMHIDVVYPLILYTEIFCISIEYKNINVRFRTSFQHTCVWLATL